MKPSGHDSRPRVHDENCKCDRPKSTLGRRQHRCLCVDRVRLWMLGNSDRRLHTWPSPIKADGRSEGGFLRFVIVVVDLHGIRYFTRRAMTTTFLLVGKSVPAPRTRSFCMNPCCRGENRRSRESFQGMSATDIHHGLNKWSRRDGTQDFGEPPLSPCHSLGWVGVWDVTIAGGLVWKCDMSLSVKERATGS